MPADGFLGLPAFREPDRRWFRGVMARRDDRGRERLLFDFTYRGGSGLFLSQTMIAFRFPGRNFPRFWAHPETWADRIGARLGAQDIDFEDHPKFSEAYALRGEDEGAVRPLFGTGILDALGDRPDCAFEGYGEWILFYRPSRVVPVGALGAFVSDAEFIRTLFEEGLP